MYIHYVYTCIHVQCHSVYICIYKYALYMYIHYVYTCIHVYMYNVIVFPFLRLQLSCGCAYEEVITTERLYI